MKVNEIEKTILIKQANLKVLRLKLKAGTALPSHTNTSHVIAIPMAGKGKFTINNIAHNIISGEALEINPGIFHDIYAETDIEIIVIHIGSTDHEHNCNSCS